MGTFRVPIDVGDFEGRRFVHVDALVDTGATYTWIPRDVLEPLDIRSDEKCPFVLAAGRQVEYDIAWVRLRMDGRTQPTLAVFGDPGTEALLGAFTLEGFRLAPDPVNRRLISVPALLKSAGQSRHVACDPAGARRGGTPSRNPQEPLSRRDDR